MATLTSGVEYFEQNLKFPGISKYLAMRVALLSAGTSRTLPVPSLSNNPAQINPVNPLLPFNTPQQGRKFIPYSLVTRDVSSAIPNTPGNLSGSGASGGGAVSIINQSQSNAVVAVLTAPATAAPAQVLISNLTAAANLIGPYDQLAVQYQQPTGATATATGFTVDLFGFWQGGI